MFKSAKSNRISKNIVQQIRAAIFKGELKPGDRLPPEKELAEHFDVSKASLREAFRALEALGFLEVRQGMSGGAFVREVDLETARDTLSNYLFFQNPSIEDFTQLRRMIEPHVCELAAQKISAQQLSDIEANLIETKHSLDSGSFSYEIDIDFHRKIASIINNSPIYLIVDSMQSALVNIKHLLQPDRDFSVKVYFAHRRILDALSERDPEKSRVEMLRHINEVEEGLLALSRQREGSFKREVVA
jgi:GntR family transcriptional repressor for pyruvate dehydrogenase complex